jgi:hypothetical protein
MNLSAVLKTILSSDYMNVYDAAQTISSRTGEATKSIHSRLSKWIVKEPKSWVLVNRTLNLLGYKLQISKIGDIQMIEFLKKVLPIDQYGIGQAKPFEKLIKEIESGETQIIFENNNPIRIIQTARVYVYCKGKQLVEAKQIINGNERFRNFKSVSEKFKLDESAINAAVRGIKEELGIIIRDSDLVSLENVKDGKESPSYPGLLTRYDFYDFRWDMPEKYFKPEGYIAYEENATTYFEWR